MGSDARRGEVADDAVAAATARLLEVGASPAEVDGCGGDLDALLDLSVDVGLRTSGPLLTFDELVARSGLPRDRALAVLRHGGLAATGPDERAWFEDDARWLDAVEAAGLVFGDDGVDALIRRAGAAAEQLAHASGAVFRVSTAEALDREARPLDVLERNLAVAALVGHYLEAIGQLYRHHLRRTLRYESTAAGRLGELRDLCVGFVDVASSTALAETLDAAQLAELVASFERVAVDAAVARHVRVVKTIGDEVMLCGDRALDVCGAALELVGWCTEHPTFAAARGGVCRGPLLDQGGDCYGPVVNRAARFAEAAPDGSVLVDAAVAEEVRPELVVDERPPVEHRGLGVVSWWAVAPAGA